MIRLLMLLTAGALLLHPGGASGHGEGFASIKQEDVAAHLEAVASAPLEGRDTPSVGLRRAGDYIAERFAAAGLEGLGPDGGYRLSWSRTLPAPKKDGCELVLSTPEGEVIEFSLNEDFVPLNSTSGRAEGHPVFCGFGIRAKKEKYDDLKKVDLQGNVAVILDGEPRHRRRFEGEVVSVEADIHVKINNLAAEGVAAVVVVRRPAPDQPEDMDSPGLGFRHTWASWMPSSGQRDPRISRKARVPVVEVTPAVGSQIMGADLLALAARIDKSVKPASGSPLESTLRVAAAVQERSVSCDNIVGVVRGSDPDLAGEYVVVGAHYDHVGVDVRGQVGYGADDNGSGTSAMIEIVEALALAEPKRSILACAFSGEEDGLLGAYELARHPPVPLESLVAMINLDMVGRGKAGEVVVLGTEQNPGLDKVLSKARKLKSARVKVITGKAAHLWQRSDQYAFHKAGIPSLFFFEAASELDNKDYHTWRDTIDRLDIDKIARTARIAYSTAWILAQDEKRPSPPRDSR